MGHGKETPRQKMIGMMYLVLTALLALNVSAEVLNAFILVDKSLNKTGENFKAKIDEIYTQFNVAAQENPTKVKPFKDKADEVAKLSQEMINYMNTELKMAMVLKADGPEVAKKYEESSYDASLIQKKDENNIPSEIFFVNEKGKELKGKINDYRDKLIEMVRAVNKKKEDPPLIAALNQTFNTEDGPNQEGETQTWETLNFYQLPLAGSVTMISKLQTDIRNAEADVANYLLGQIEAGTFKFNKVEAIVNSPSNYVLKNQPYKAEVFIAASDSTQDPEIYIGANKLTVKGGKGIYTGNTSSVGIKSWGGVIKLKNPTTGDIQEYPFRSEYQVGEPSMAVSPTKMNVFYIGVPNPVDITVSGVPQDKIGVSISNGKISRKGDGYIVQVKGGKDANITVTAKMDDGSSRNMGTKNFRVKKVPDPKAKIKLGTELSVGGVMKKNKLANARVVADLENFDFDLQFRISEFTLSATLKGYVEEAKSRSGKLTSEQLAILKRIPPGQKVYFENIEAKGPDGSVRKLGSISFKLN